MFSIKQYDIEWVKQYDVETQKYLHGIRFGPLPVLNYSATENEDLTFTEKTHLLNVYLHTLSDMVTKISNEIEVQRKASVGN